MANEITLEQVLNFLKNLPSDIQVKMSYHSEKELLEKSPERIEKYLDVFLSSFYYFTDGCLGLNYADNNSVTAGELIQYIEENKKDLTDGVLIDIEDGISYSPAKGLFVFKGFAVISNSSN